MRDADIIDHLQSAGWARPVDICRDVLCAVGDDLVLRATRAMQAMARAGTVVRDGLHYRLAGADVGPAPVGSVRDLPPLQGLPDAVEPMPRRKGKMRTAKATATPKPRHRPNRIRSRPARPPRGPSASERIAADPDLGRIPAADIAARYGVAAQTVRRVMQRIGKAARMGRPAEDRPHILADRDLGRLPDRQLAIRHGVDAITVKRLRIAHGIQMTMGRPLRTLALQREAVCAAILAGHVQRRAIMAATGLDQDQVCTALTWLVQAGRVDRVGRGVYAPSSTARPPVDGDHLRAGVCDG